MELLLHWMRKQEIDDKMIYKNAAIEQECFLRDQICMNLLHTHSFVISTHMSKSIVLPVYAFTMENGINVICRENFHGWKLSVKLPKDRPYAEIIPEDLFSEGYNKDISSCLFEGFKDEWIFEGYRLDKTQRNFSFGIYSDYKFYTVMYMLKHLYEKEDFSEDVKKLTKEYVVNSINQVYNKFGYKNSLEKLWMAFPWKKQEICFECNERREIDFKGRIPWKHTSTSSRNDERGYDLFNSK